MCSSTPTTELRADVLKEYADRAAERGRAAASEGDVSAQIPELRKLDRHSFGLTVATLEGTEVAVGDAAAPFPLQSLTKLFALCTLLRHEPDAWDYVGRDVSNNGYDSISELERHAGQPRNPFVNAGALVVTDRLLHRTGDAAQAVMDELRNLSHEPPYCDHQVARSEAANGHRNRAIAHVLAEHGRLTHRVEVVLEQYFKQCAIAASTTAMARSGLLLAGRGNTPQYLDGSTARRVNAVLLTAGMYGAAGEIAYRVGLPAKSGIGGGVLAVMPGGGAICAWSPPLDQTGNSVGGVVAIEEFARLAGWSVF